jgi:hypothetical protein
MWRSPWWVLGLLGLACAPDTGSSPVVATAPTSPPPAVTPRAPAPRSVVHQVEAAYLRAWAVYAEAVGRVDEGDLGQAFAGRALVLKREEVADLRRQGRAIRVDVHHHYEIALLDAETAVVTDLLRNHMVLVDARTREPVEPDPDDILARAYTLRRRGGTWKVTDAVALA